MELRPWRGCGTGLGRSVSVVQEGIEANKMIRRATRRPRVFRGTPAGPTHRTAEMITMKTRVNVAVVLSLLLTVFSGITYGQDARSANDIVIKVTDDWLTAFNAQDAVAWAAVLNYPHVRFASGAVSSWRSREEYAAMATKRFPTLVNNGWDHSVWLRRDVTLSSRDKVHVSVEFERFTADGESLGVYQALFIVTDIDGHWGVQGVSTLSPY